MIQCKIKIIYKSKHKAMLKRVWAVERKSFGTAERKES